MSRGDFKRQWRRVRVYIRDEGSRQKAALRFHKLAPLLGEPSALGSLPHQLPSGRVILRDPPLAGPVGSLP